MPRVVRGTSPARASDDNAPSPTRPKRNLKRSASQALLLTPPRTVKRERKRRIGKRTISHASKSPRSRSRGSGRETELEASDHEDEEASLGDGVGRRLNFSSGGKRRRKEDLDARLETLLESFVAEDPENPFWDGPSKARATETADREKGDVKKSDEKGKSIEKTVRIRSPSPPLLSYRAKAPVSPPPSNRRRKKKVDVVTVVETIVESKVEEAVEPLVEEETSVELPVESTEEPSAKETVEPPPESTEESPAQPADEAVKPAVEPAEKSPEGPSAEPADELAVLDLPPLPSTPKKGKRRYESPIRDSPNNPFLNDSPSSVSGEPAEPRTPTARAEKPTTIYNFRGVRVEFANPMYNLPAEVRERSLLPIEHPDYSPNPACSPKRLFSELPPRKGSRSPIHRDEGEPVARSRSAAKPSGPSGNDWDDSDDEAELDIPLPRRLFH